MKRTNPTTQENGPTTKRSKNVHLTPESSTDVKLISLPRLDTLDSEALYASLALFETQVLNHKTELGRRTEMVPNELWQKIFSDFVLRQSVKSGLNDLLSLGTVCKKFLFISNQILKKYFSKYKDKSQVLLGKFSDSEKLVIKTTMKMTPETSAKFLKLQELELFPST